MAIIFRKFWGSFKRGFVPAFVKPFLTTIALVMLLSGAAGMVKGFYQQGHEWVLVAGDIFIVSALIQHAVWLWGRK